jgi:hypothetical protein
VELKLFFCVFLHKIPQTFRTARKSSENCLPQATGHARTAYLMAQSPGKTDELGESFLYM